MGKEKETTSKRTARFHPPPPGGIADDDIRGRIIRGPRTTGEGSRGTRTKSLYYIDSAASGKHMVVQRN